MEKKENKKDKLTKSRADRGPYYQSISNLEDEGRISSTTFNYAPNPVIDVLTVQSSINLKRVRVLDVKKKVVLDQLGGNTKKIQLNLSHLPAGEYFVEVEGERKAFLKK